MRYFARCLAIFVVLSIILSIGSAMLIETQVPLAFYILVSAFTSLLLTLLYGWIDAVYIQKRQPNLENE